MLYYYLKQFENNIGEKRHALIKQIMASWGMELYHAGNTLTFQAERNLSWKTLEKNINGVPQKGISEDLVWV